jgi:hypothetical protein
MSESAGGSQCHESSLPMVITRICCLKRLYTRSKIEMPENVYTNVFKTGIVEFGGPQSQVCIRPGCRERAGGVVFAPAKSEFFHVVY